MAKSDDDSTPRVFLSYRRDDLSDIAGRRLKDALEVAGYAPWRDLAPGEDAGLLRDRSLARASAAVVIVSPDALESEWMHAEVQLLVRRAASDPAFVLVALPTGGVDPIRLHEWSEGLRPFAVDHRVELEAQVEQVLQRLEPLRSVGGASAPSAAGRSTVLGAGVHAEGVRAIAFVALGDRPRVVTADGVGTLRVIDVAEGAVRQELEGLHSGLISAISVGSLRRVPVVVSGGDDGMVRVVDLVDWKPAHARRMHDVPVCSLALIDVGTGKLRAVTGGSNGTVRAVELVDEEQGDWSFKPGHDGPVRSVAIVRRDGRPVVISGGEDGRIRLWDPSFADVSESWDAHTGAVRAVATAELDGRPIAVSGGVDGMLRLWALDGDPLGEPLQAHADGILALATTTFASRPIAVSAGDDATVRVWDLATLTAIGGPLRGHEGPVAAVVTGIVDTRPVIVSGGRDGTVRLWDLPGFDGAQPGTRHVGVDDRVEWISDARATVDLLQRRPLAAALATRLRRLREDEPGRSFLIHLDGRWGSGKSTLLDLLRKDLADEWLVVEFDAWRQMRVGTPWWALLASLRHAVKRDLGPHAATRLRAAETWQRVRRGGALYVVAIAGLLALVVGVALLLGAGVDLGTAGTVAKSIAAVAASIGVLYAALSAVGRFLLWDSAAGARVFEQSHRDPMESVADHFAWLIARAGRPVMFFVDDLDRCANSYVVDLLDSIQTLIRDAPARIADRADRDRACYVVVAADGRWIRTSYELAHADIAAAVEEPGKPLGYQFLDKIFQLTVPVPSISAQRQQVYLQALLRIKQDDGRHDGLATQVQSVVRRVERSTSETEALEAFDDAPAEVRAAVAGSVVSKLAEPQMQEATQHRLERFAGLLEANPRAMKLVLNAYGIARALQVMEDNVVPGDALALWTILRVRWPALADYVRAHPDAIDALADGHAHDGAPPQLAALFSAPHVVRVVRCEDGGPLTAATIRACCGITDDTAASPAPPAEKP